MTSTTYRQPPSRLTTTEEQTMWERKEEGLGEGRRGRPWGEEEEEEEYVPGGKRETCGRDFSDWWSSYNYGFLYDEDEPGDMLFWRAVLAELAATAAFVFFVTMAWMSLQQGMTDGGIVRIALTAGVSFAVLNWAFFNVSGGHMNPAVTLALCLNARITVVRTVCYWAAQIVGAILGAALARGCSPAGFSGVQGAANRLTTITWGGAFLAEILGTLLVVYAFLVTYDKRRRFYSSPVNTMAPWMIGMAVLAAHLILIPYTWCSVNPARSFGSAVVYGLWGNHWIWWVSPIIAAVAGSLLYESFFKFFYSPEEEKPEYKERGYTTTRGEGQPTYVPSTGEGATTTQPMYHPGGTGGGMGTTTTQPAYRGTRGEGQPSYGPSTGEGVTTTQPVYHPGGTSGGKGAGVGTTTTQPTYRA